MKQYTVAYIKNGEDYAYDTYKEGTTIVEIVDDINYTMNRYGVNYDEISIFEFDDDNPAHWYQVVKIYGNYELEELV